MNDTKQGRTLGLALALGLWMLGSGAAAQEREIELPDDFLVRECDSASAGERDRCLAGLALRTNNPAVCESAPAGRCQEFGARAGMAECARSHHGEQRHLCEMSVLTEYPAPDACADSLDENACIMTVAATRKEPNLIAERISDPRQMQIYMGAYVAAARDLRGLDYIEDPFMHDMSLANAAFAVGYGQDRELGTAYCGRMKGNYGPRHQDISAETVAGLCRFVSAMSDSLLAREQSTEMGRFREETMAELETLLTGLASGELDIGDVIPELKDDFDGEDGEGAAGVQTTDAGVTDCRGRLSDAAGVYEAAWGPLTCTAAGDNLRCYYHSHQKWSLDLSLEGPNTLTGEWSHNGYRGDSRTGAAEFSLDERCQLSSGAYGYGDVANTFWRVGGKQ